MLLMIADMLSVFISVEASCVTASQGASEDAANILKLSAARAALLTDGATYRDMLDVKHLPGCCSALQALGPLSVRWPRSRCWIAQSCCAAGASGRQTETFCMLSSCCCSPLGAACAFASSSCARVRVKHAPKRVRQI
jgi:hypothetical protein